MNETKEYIASPIEGICRVCLKRTSSLYPMCEIVKTLYKSYVEIIADEENMKTCTICGWMLRKLSKFQHQCQMANKLLNHVIYMDTKNPILDLSINLTQTKIHSFSYIAPLDRKDKLSNNSLCTNYKLCHEKYNLTNNINIYDISSNNEENELKNENGNDDSHDNNVDSHDNNVDSHDNNVDIHDNNVDSNDYDFDNDEIPLVLLKNERKIKKRLKNDRLSKEINGKAKKIEHKNKKKELKEGFTSRMVQETEEYVVIKLTKEQVLKEMEERSKTDAYLRSPFKCEKCIKGFNFDEVLQTHLEKHTMKNGSFQCEMCYQYCPSAVSLRGHIKSHTTRYKCKVCSHTRLSRQHLLEHHAISHSAAAATYTCHHCSFTSNKRTIMQRHVRRHASSEAHACHRCGKLFKSIESLRLHTARHDKSSRFKCSRCDASFVYVSLLRRHEQCVHLRRDYYCVECDIQFISSESLRLHFKKAKKHRDSSANKHVCPHCPVRFFTRSSLSVHLTNAHSAPRSHACVTCSRTYSSGDALRAHIWRAHARPTHCGDCARKSTSKSNACRCNNTLDNQEKKHDVQYESKIEE